MKKRLGVRILSVILSVACALGIFGCSCNEEKESEKAYGKDVLTVWADTSMGRTTRHNVDVDTTQKVMVLESAKNEYEGGQVMLRASEDVSSYDISVSDLTCGNNVISKENVEIYSVKYIDSSNLMTSLYNDALPNGNDEVPDALLPFETAIEFGENKLIKDTNQAVYVEIFVPEYANAGVYSGKVTVNIDKLSYSMKIVLTVHDFTIPNEPNTMCFSPTWSKDHYANIEFDTSEEAEKKRYDFMLKYRVSGKLPFEGKGGSEKYVELLREYYTKSGFSSYKFFYEPTFSYYGDLWLPLNVTVLKDYVYAIAQASVEDRVDYFSKAVMQLSTYIDEPDTNPVVTWDMVRTASKGISTVLRDLAYELDVELAGEENYDFWVSNIHNSVENMPNICAGSFTMDVLEQENCMEITPAPSVVLYNNESVRESFKREGYQTWWYTCGGDKYPYPGLSVNQFLVSQRLISWMQCAYDIDGFFFYDNLYYCRNDGYTITVDTYSKLSDSFLAKDGAWFYPGKPYGLDTPVASLRTVAYRDGMEDYEVLNKINEVYAEKGLDADIILKDVYADLFSGVLTTSDVALFNGARREVFNILETCQGNDAILYHSLEKSDNGQKLTFEVVNKNATVKVDGVTVNKNGEGLYVVEVNSTVKSTADITVTTGSIERNYSKYLGGSVVKVADYEDGTKLLTKNGSSSTEISTSKAHRGSKSEKVNLVKPEGSKAWFGLNPTAVNSLENVEKISLAIYSDISMELDVYLRYTKNGATYSELISTVTIESGWNEKDISVSKKIRDRENKSAIRFETDVISSTSIYVDDITYSTVLKREYPKNSVNGEIEVNGSKYTPVSGDKSIAILDNDVSNVTENGYLMLADFETYNQVAQLAMYDDLGKVEMVTDHVMHGNYALKIDVSGFGNDQGHYDPTLIVFTTQDYFSKTDFSDVDYLEVDIYNAMDYDLNVKFSKKRDVMSVNRNIKIFTLKPGANHLVIDLQQFKSDSSEFTGFCFVFDRWELFGENRTIYIDNFRAHFA